MIELAEDVARTIEEEVVYPAKSSHSHPRVT